MEQKFNFTPISIDLTNSLQGMQIEYDQSTVTMSDYAVEIYLTQE